VQGRIELAIIDSHPAWSVLTKCTFFKEECELSSATYHVVMTARVRWSYQTSRTSNNAEYKQLHNRNIKKYKQL